MDIPITHEQAQRAGVAVGGATLTGIWLMIKRHFSVSNRVTILETKLQSYDEKFDRIEANLQTIIAHLIAHPKKQEKKR